MRHNAIATVLTLLAGVESGQACDIIPFKREPTVAEMVAGLDEIYAGSVVGYVKEDGTQLLGPIPSQCKDEDGDYPWWRGTLNAPCDAYLDVVAALFRVDTQIVGPEKDAVVPSLMTWGDGDCNIDYLFGEKWLISGYLYTRELTVPVTESEVEMLRDMAAQPKFDFRMLY